MAEANISKELDVSIGKLYATITDYEKYSKFVDGVKKVKIISSEGNKVVVNYALSMMGKDVSYDLEHTHDEKKASVKWKLLKGDIFKKNSGSWKLKKVDEDTTHIDYDLEVEFGIPVPGFLLNRLVKGSLPAMLEAFEKRAKKL